MSTPPSLPSTKPRTADKLGAERVAQTAAMLVERGVQHGASDIHIEPRGRAAMVRYRIDGQLHSLHKLPLSALGPLLAKFKELAGLKPAVRMPQEGVYATAVGGDELRVRVAVMPVLGGEKAVLHLSPQNNVPANLQALGFWGDGLARVRAALAQAYGLVLVAGPQHAQRSAMLYAMLRLLQAAGLSVATVENPIEQQLAGVMQTGVQTALSMQAALTAALQKDTHAIMLSDIPNEALAAQLVQAASNSHLVLAGTYGDTAAQAVKRLEQLRLEPFLLATGLRLAVSQCAARRLCPNCRRRYALTRAQLAEFAQAFGFISPDAWQQLHELEQQAAREGLGASQPLGSTPSAVTYLWKADPNGCVACHHSGLAGTLLLNEVLTPAEHACAQASPTAAQLDTAVPLKLDGLVKALRGETSLEEVRQALGPAAA